ncbi:unnamed protein product, partial [marine sediment metagenome]
GKTEEAINAHQKLVEISPGWSWALGRTYALTGQIEKAEEILSEIEKMKARTWWIHARIVMYAALGMNDEAFKWLEHDPLHAFTAWIAVQPEGENLRKDPRFQDFLARLNLPN